MKLEQQQTRPLFKKVKFQDKSISASSPGSMQHGENPRSGQELHWSLTTMDIFQSGLKT